MDLIRSVFININLSHFQSFFRRKLESQKKIVHGIGDVKDDALSFGLHGVKSNIIGYHFLRSAYGTRNNSEEEMKMKVIYYGAVLPKCMISDIYTSLAVLALLRGSMSISTRLFSQIR